MKALILSLCLCLAACSSAGKRATETFDLGMPQSALPGSGKLRIAVEVKGSAALESAAISYRLNYANGTQLRDYALARWTAPATQLVGQRLSQLLAYPGIHERSASPCVLRVELDEFSQVFDTPQSSRGVLSARLSLLGKQGLIARVPLTTEAPAPSADSRGGVAALGQATTQLAGAIIRWQETQAAQGALTACQP